VVVEDNTEVVVRIVEQPVVVVVVVDVVDH
jgi:hypothetical protein